MTDIQGLPARRAALHLLDAVLRRGQALEAALSGATGKIDNPADRALAHAIASETLRHIPDLDDLIDGATRQRLPDDAKARMVLRMALVQVLILGTPPHAAIATALPLLEGGPRRLVHGVLGTLFRAKAQLRRVPVLPPKVEARWTKAWGAAMVGMAAEALAAPPPLDLTLKDPATTADWVAQLAGESLAPGHVRVARDQAVTELPGFADGAWWVQNISASVPARLLGAGHGRTVLDLCAAPGGKTMQLAAAGWQVTAVERDQRRLDRLAENLDQTGLTAPAGGSPGGEGVAAIHDQGLQAAALRGEQCRPLRGEIDAEQQQRPGPPGQGAREEQGAGEGQRHPRGEIRQQGHAGRFQFQPAQAQREQDQREGQPEDGRGTAVHDGQHRGSYAGRNPGAASYSIRALMTVRRATSSKASRILASGKRWVRKSAEVSRPSRIHWQSCGWLSFS